MSIGGNITRRGDHSWRLKFDIGRDPATGERRTQFVTVKGTKQEAKAELAKKLSDVATGQFVERSAVTLADYARHWIADIAPARTSGKTLERYAEIVEKHIIPQLGTVTMQKLDGAAIDRFYSHLRTNGRRNGEGGLSPQTVVHIHRLLSQILKSAVKAKKLHQSPMAAVQTTPKVRREEVEILDQPELATLYRHLRGRPLYMPVVLAGSTGMRRGEVLALRWRDIDFDALELRVSQVLEQTKGAIKFKEPKTDGSRRTITLTPTLVAELREHRRAQLEWRLKNGLGKDPLDLVFPAWNGAVRSPNVFTKDFSREVEAAKLTKVTFHALRHTHITELLRNAVPVHVVSKRAGHANPTITLNIYAHKLKGDDKRVTELVEQALKTALRE